MTFEDLKYLNTPLPENILKEKWSGHFDLARKMIEYRLENENVSKAMKARLELELQNMQLFEERYTYTEDEAVKAVQKRIPDFTREELEELRINGKVDYAYINGELRFLDSFVGTLFGSFGKEFWPRAVEEEPADDNANLINDFVLKYKDKDEAKAFIHVKHEIYIDDEEVEEGKILKLHIPLPHETDELSEVKLIAADPIPDKLPSIDELQPTAYFEFEYKKGMRPFVEYSLINTMKIHDTSKLDLDLIMEAYEKEGYPKNVQKYLEEKAPHIVFTPYLKDLCAEIVGDEVNPLLKARAIYDWVTQNVKYRYMREYASIDNIPEYIAAGRRGDCGVQGLIFITLCRIAGVPAYWQSGLDAEPNSVGEHDWAKFYIPAVGWMYCDPSFGTSAWRNQNMDKWNFYFGNLDPYRLPFNNDVQEELVPAKKFPRKDPYDNQTGEAEYDDKGFTAEHMHRTFTDLGIKIIEE
ncbi:MAG: transglutaminase-like domain-containing protein [Clostridia bacterium]|nr:transglutaminase-like domain-containing protein [Clostridia bacterium]